MSSSADVYRNDDWDTNVKKGKIKQSSFTRVAANVIEADMPKGEDLKAWVESEVLACKQECDSRGYIYEDSAEAFMQFDCALRGYALANTHKTKFEDDMLEHLAKALMNIPAVRFIETTTTIHFNILTFEDKKEEECP